VVVIHGVGDYKKGDYNKLLASLEQAVGPAKWKTFAVYTVLYDLLNDWAAEKTQASALTDKLIERLKFHFDTSKLGALAAEGAGDVLWPVLELDARSALRDAVLAQLQQAVLDGDNAGILRRDQQISIIGHSLGCFHTYEALSAAAADPRYRMQPAIDKVQFDSVVLMASPVQVIRSVAGWLGQLVPDPDGLYCLRNSRLEMPGQTNAAGRFIPSARRFISLTGTLDPVGGYLMRRKLDWGYMNIAGQESVVDDQQLLAIDDEKGLIAALQGALAGAKGLPFTADNPHDWVGYVDRNAALVKEWLLS
jgi:hypothetical protein